MLLVLPLPYAGAYIYYLDFEDDKLNNVTNATNDAQHDLVPENFPRPSFPGAIAGFQPKLLLVEYEGRFYAPGCTPPELYKRWRRCEDIAEHLRVKSLESKAGKRSHMTESEILEQYLVRLLATGWVSAPEARWTIRRSAELLGGWPVPHDAKDLPEELPNPSKGP
jgi:hypothetical protein